MKSRIITAVSVCCEVFTVIIAVMALIVSSLEEEGQALGLTPGKIMMFLAFSAVIGGSSLLITGKKTGAVKYILHFGMCFAAFISFVMIGNGLSVKNAFFLLLLVSFCMLYGVCMLVRYFVKRSSATKAAIVSKARKVRKANKREEDSSSDEYTSILKKD